MYDAESDECLLLTRESAEIDCLGALGGGKESDEGDDWPGMRADVETMVGYIELFAVMKESGEGRAEDEGLGEVCCPASAMKPEGWRKEEASGISMGGKEGIVGKSICWLLVVMLNWWPHS